MPWSRCTRWLPTPRPNSLCPQFMAGRTREVSRLLAVAAGLGEGDTKTHPESTQRLWAVSGKTSSHGKARKRLQEATGAVLSPKAGAGCPAQPAAPRISLPPCVPPVGRGIWRAWRCFPLASGAQAAAVPSSSAALALRRLPDAAEGAGKALSWQGLWLHSSSSAGTEPQHGGRCGEQWGEEDSGVAPAPRAAAPARAAGRRPFLSAGPEATCGLPAPCGPPCWLFQPQPRLCPHLTALSPPPPALTSRPSSNFQRRGLGR